MRGSSRPALGAWAAKADDPAAKVAINTQAASKISAHGAVAPVWPNRHARRSLRVAAIAQHLEAEADW